MSRQGAAPGRAARQGPRYTPSLTDTVTQTHGSSWTHTHPHSLMNLTATLTHIHSWFLQLDTLPHLIMDLTATLSHTHSWILKLHSPKLIHGSYYYMNPHPIIYLYSYTHSQSRMDFTHTFEHTGSWILQPHSNTFPENSYSYIHPHSLKDLTATLHSGLGPQLIPKKNSK